MNLTYWFCIDFFLRSCSYCIFRRGNSDRTDFVRWVWPDAFLLRNVDFNISVIVEFWAKCHRIGRSDADRLLQTQFSFCGPFIWLFNTTDTTQRNRKYRIRRRIWTMRKCLTKSVSLKSGTNSLYALSIKVHTTCTHADILHGITTSSATLYGKQQLPKRLDRNGEAEGALDSWWRTWTERKSHSYVRQTHSIIHKLWLLLSLALYIALSLSRSRILTHSIAVRHHTTWTLSHQISASIEI